MIKYLNYFSVILLLSFLSSCKLTESFLPTDENDNSINLDNNEVKNDKVEIRIGCGEGNIKDFIKEGWKIKKELSEEKICSWKSVPANNNCDMEKDKGCKITIPDIIGKETIYFLEK
tara:strand:- start:12404 stop:12754 length:351 start_codon:yes stop_codon:yes gene_type:complete